MSPEASPPDIRILGGDPTPEELAALTAVLGAALDELASEAGRRQDAGMPAWARSQRSLRKPLVHGDWRRFGV
ncbi:MAG: acyl-CoA carboxylase subunit epsilon [Microbacteriaceae bacterium]|nr:acyl-CoA carboxylase subunit epsilon [Microbacteriaceae bacterium]